MKLFGAALVVLACLCGSSALAGEKEPAAVMTCEQFKSRLADTIANAGKRVLTPFPYTKAFSDVGRVHDRYEYSNISGITGDLNCVENDRFQSFDISGNFDGVDATESVKLLFRVQALASAALCVATTANQKACDAEVGQLVNIATQDIKESDLRGEKAPAGDALRDYPNVDEVDKPHAEIEINMVRGGLYVSVWGQ
jgi:hypothetical protein